MSTILLFCILPVANANNGNIKIKFIRELVTSSSKSLSIDQEQSLSGFGVEFYGNLIDEGRNGINDKKGRMGLILETRLLNGAINYAASSNIINVRKSVIEIGVRIDW